MAYQSKFMREQFETQNESNKNGEQYQSRFMQQMSARSYQTPGALPTQTIGQASAYRDFLRSIGKESTLVPYRGTSGDSPENEWKGFGVNDPDKTDWKENAPANLVDLIKMQYDNPPNRTGFAAGSVSGASAPTNDELIAFRTELSNSPDIAMRYRWANASDEDVAAELQRRKQAELQNQEYQRLMEQNAKNMTLDDYIDPSYRLNDFDKTRAQEIIDAFYEKYPKDGKWYNGDYSPNTRKAMYNDPDMQKIVILENKLNPVASLVYGAKNALPIDPFGKTYENAVEKLYDAVGADQSAYDTLHNTMEGTRSASSNAQTQNPVAYLGGYMGTNIGLYKGGKDIMLGLPGIGKGLKAAGGAISNAASKVPVVGSTLGRVLTADRVAGFLGDSALDLALDTIPNEVVTGFEEGEGAAQIAKDAAGNMAQNALFNVAGEVVPATIKGTSNLITRGQMNRIADALDDGAKLTAEQISEYNRLAAKVGEIGSEDWLNVNMAKYADEMPVKNAAQPIATGTEASVPSMADMFPLSNKTPVQSETDALVNAFYNNTLTNAQIETLKPGGKNRAAFEAATGLPLPETASKTRALLKLGAEESIDGTLKTEYNGVNRGVQNGTANPASASVASGEGIPLERQGFGSDSNVASGRQYTGGNRGTVSVLNNNVNGGVQNEPTGAERVSGVFENTMPVGPGMGSGHGQPGELAGGNQVLYRVLNNDRTTSDALTRVGSAYTDLHDTTAQPQVFTAALDDAIKANKHGLMVSSKTPQALADSGAVTFMTNDGLAGAAVTADGDIEAVFKNPASQIKRASAPLMLNAIENGGRKLDCYGIDLVQNYNKFGFEPVARVAWNPEYAPDGWTYGPKDVYVMKLADGLDADGVKARLGFSESDGGFHKWTQPELDALPEMDYDAALAYRDSLLEQGAKPVANRRADVDTGVISADNKRNGGVLNGQQEDGQQGGRFGLAGALSYDGAAETAGRTVTGEGSESSKTHRRLDETAKALFEDRRNADIARIRRIGEAEIKTIPAVQAEYTQGTKDALQFFSEYGIIPEVIQGPGILKVNGTYAFMNGDAQTLRDGTVLLRNDASLPAREIAAHEAMHHMQRVKKKLYEPALEAMQESGINPIGQNGEINPLLKSYLNVYTAEYDGDLPLENLTTLYRELSAQLAGRLQNDPHEAQEVFGDLFFDYTGVAEAINSSLAALKADAQSAQRQLGTSLSETVSAKPLAERADGAASSVSARVQPNARAQTQNAPEIPSGMKERGFAESLRTKSDLPTEVKQEFIDNPELYKSLSNETTVARAEEIFARGETEARNAFSDMLKTADPAAVPLGKMIADDLIAKGDRAGAVNVLRDMSAALTRSGQFSQAAVIALTKADPMTALQYIQRQVDTMNAAGAKKFGRKWNDFELTDAEIDAFKNIDPGDTQAVETAMENVGKRISKEYPVKGSEQALELWRIGMLLNPRTMIRNTLANAAMMPVQGTSGKVSALIQDITHWINPDFTPTQALHVSKESKTLASQVADNMRSVLSGDTKYYEFQGQGAGAKGQTELNSLNQYARDKTVFKGEIKNDWLSQLVDKTAYELNKVSQKTAQQDLFSGMTSEKGILENTRQLTYGLLELGDAGFVDKFFRDRLANYIEARGIKSVNDVPPEAITTALDEAMKATFKDDNALTEMLSSIKRSTNRVGGMGNFLLTFTKTPANIAMRIADYSPAGLASAAVKRVKGQTDAAQFIDDISKGLTGTGLMVLGAQLFKAGILTGPESDDKDEAAFMRTQGFKPNAVHVGDKYYTIDWATPSASGLMMGAAVMAELEKNPDASFVDASVAAGKTALNTWVAASPIKNFSDLFSSYEGLAGGVSDLLQGIPSGFIPSVVGATARTVDPVQRQTYSKGDWLGTLFGEMQAKIPGASKSLPAAYDTWGRPITRQNSTGEAAFAQFVSPGTLGNANESPIDNVILELFQDTGNNKVFPRKAGWSVTVDGESKSLTNREYSDYQREMGQMSYNIAEYLVPKFDNLTDEQKVSVLDNAYSMAKDVAENELFGADLSRTTEKRMEEASALDGTQYANWAEILFAHAIIKDVTGDKVPGTDRTISGSAKKNKIAALVDAGYSQYQAMQLYDLLNG